MKRKYVTNDKSKVGVEQKLQSDGIFDHVVKLAHEERKGSRQVTHQSWNLRIFKHMHKKKSIKNLGRVCPFDILNTDVIC